MKYIGKIDTEKLGKFKEKLITDKVFLTTERLAHIKNHHPGDFEMYEIYLQNVLEEPDYILEDTKNIDTVIILKRIPEKEKNIQLIIKLSTGIDKKRNKNSVLTLWKVRNSTYNQLIRNKKIIYKNE